MPTCDKPRIQLPLHLRGARSVMQKGTALSRDCIASNILRRAGLKDAGKIPTFTTSEELQTLLTLALELEQGATVVEIGSYLGASTAYLAAGGRSRTSEIVCIDTWQNETMPEGVLDTFAAFNQNLRSVLHTIRTVRKSTAVVTAGDLPAQADLIFIDGDHSYSAVKHDFALMEPLVNGRTTIVFHDTAHFEGPSRVVGECLAGGKWRLHGVCQNLTWLRPITWTK